MGEREVRVRKKFLYERVVAATMLAGMRVN